MVRYLLAAFLLGATALLMLESAPARAEPWLSTRYAQDCAGCHAPGRKNVVAIERRCTLSCQGCHVNPNGGGLRSFYGKWNEERWLRSFRSDALHDRNSFAPVGKQHYGKDGALARESKDGKDGKKDKSKTGPGKDGFPLVEIANDTMPERLYTREDGLEKIITKDHDEFMYQVPQQDPLRLMDLTKVNAGGDVRWEATQYSRNSGRSVWHSFLMDADFGMEWRPINHYVHVVYEARMEGTPAPNTKYDVVLGKAQTRSLYLMVDDLPYNIFAMYGYYRPLFGNFVPDHYTLAQELTSYGLSGGTKNYNLAYEAVSIGTAPNVPYLNVHLINKQLYPADPADATKGFALNMGLRFVTLGASLNYSYWSTTDQQADKTTKTQMHSIGGAGRLARTTMSLEFVSMQRDVDTQDFRQGGVYTFDTQTQVWKENYFTFLYAHSNTTTEGLPGKASQVKTGVRSFLVPGVDVMFLVQNRTDEDDKNKVTAKLTGYESQLHLFF